MTANEKQPHSEVTGKCNNGEMKSLGKTAAWKVAPEEYTGMIWLGLCDASV